MEGKTIITNEIRFYPLLVSGAGLEQQTESESEQVWEQLDRIPIQNKKILLSASIIENLYNAEKQFGWEPYYSARLAYFIRELFFQNISQTEFYKASEALFVPQYQNRFNEILAYINNTLLASQPDPEELAEDEETNLSNREDLKQYTLLDALGKFPNLGNQLITTENIKLKSQVALVRPTLSNWLKNYRDELGIGMHDAVARAKFLFESKNTESLPSKERERIHAIVRSLEDNEAINIDLQKQVIVFMDEEKNESVSDSKTSTPESNTPSPDIFERFQNIQPREELKNVGTQTFMAAKPIEEKKPAPEEAVLGRIKNMLVFPPKANAPAPESDFIQPEEGETPLLSNEPLGTLRFSAKHVLPAERQEGTRQVPQSPPMDPRIAHFGPQEVNIPGTQKAYTYAPKNAPGGPTMPRSPQPAPVPQKPEPVVAPSPQISNPNVFRIKPNRD